MGFIRKCFILATIITLAALSGEALAQSGGAFFAMGPNLNVARVAPHTTRLADGRVVIFGGFGTGYRALNTAEVWNPATNKFTVLAMKYPHARGGLARLADGRYLLVGGLPDNDSGPLPNTAEIYHPGEGSFTATGKMIYGRGGCSAVTLSEGVANGKVLLVGGWVGTRSDQRSSVYGELFDPGSGAFKVTGPLNVPRSYPVVLPTSDGKAVVIGGYGPTNYASRIESVELYDPATNIFTLLREHLLPGESGWSCNATHFRFEIENQKLSDGRFLLTMGKLLESNRWQYSYYTFDPVSKTIARFATTPPLPDTGAAGLYFAPMVDTAKGKAYQLATVNSGATPVFPVELRLLTVDLAKRTRTDPADSYHLPPNWAPWFGGLSLLKDGRLFNMGGFTDPQNMYTSPIKQTLFISPAPAPKSGGAAAIELLLD